MKNKITKTIGFTAFTLMMFIAVAQISIYGQEEKEEVLTPSELSAQPSNRIVGVWMTTVTPRNCQTGVQVAPSFQGLITFSMGGTLAEYGANPMTPFRSPGHGIWAQYRGNGRYSFAFTFFPLTPTGVPVGRLRVTQRAVLDGDNFSSTGTFELRDPGGNVLATGCTTSTATPFE